MSAPKILVIDDQFGRVFKDRRNLCISFGLLDITGDDKEHEKVKNPIARAVFCSGQKLSGGRIENDVQTAIQSLQSGWPDKEGNFWALVLLDIRFVSGKIGNDGAPKGLDGDTDFGIRILEEIVRQNKNAPVVMLSSRERNEVIEECRNKGALDFIQRGGISSGEPSPKDTLREKLFQHALLPDTRELSDEGERIVGRALSLLLTLRSTRRAATGSGNVLILGETGTGKELLAKYIHDVSPHSTGNYNIFHPFGTAETLQEDELFGHVKGAFTGATSDRAGLFELSNNGTLFIDEIGDISGNLQSKLLRPLENRVVSRQGTNQEIPLDVQIVLATNKNLDEYTQKGKFKSDLLNRINAYAITIPPLRERKEDILLIAEKLTENLCREHSARWPRKISSDTMHLLKSHEWSDNVRGLRNVLERAIKDNKDSELIVPSDIRFDTGSAESEPSSQAISMFSNPIDELVGKMLNLKFSEEYGDIHGKLPKLQEAVAKLMANYLQCALEATRKMKPGNSLEGEVNVTGAASCMMGKQLKTPKAADLIKKLLQLNGADTEKLIEEHPLLKKAYSEALRLRPKKPKAK